MNTQNENDSQKLIGVLAQFDDADALLEGGKSAHDAGYEKLDAFSPFPVHGIDQAIGIKRTILPFICLAVGIGACGGGIFLQWYTNSASSSPVFPGYNFFISGKPMWSLPANVPVIFEIIVLSSAFAAFFGMLILNKLPQFANPLHRIARFRRVTNDRFFLTVDEADPKFDLDTTMDELRGWGASEVEPVYEDQTDQGFPPFVKTAGILLALVLMIPPVLIYRARGMTARQPRLHVNPDMDFQVKYKAQAVGPNMKLGDRDADDFLFADIRAAREPIPGTIAQGHLELDSEYFRGIKAGSEDAHAGSGSAQTFVSLQENELRNSEQEAGTGNQENSEELPGNTATQEEEAPSEAGAATQEPTEAEGEPEPDWVTEYPAALTIDIDTLNRGKKMYEINCVACHGYSGNGDGLVSKRAAELAKSGQAAWTEAKNLHHPEVIEQPVGRIFDTITNGRSTMGPYGQRITVEDRWAIVLYIRALQETRVNSDEKFIPPVVEEGTTEENNDEAAENGNENSAEESADGEPADENAGSGTEPDQEQGESNSNNETDQNN